MRRSRSWISTAIARKVSRRLCSARSSRRCRRSNKYANMACSHWRVVPHIRASTMPFRWESCPTRLHARFQSLAAAEVFGARQLSRGNSLLASRFRFVVVQLPGICVQGSVTSCWIRRFAAGRLHRLPRGRRWRLVVTGALASFAAQLLIGAAMLYIFGNPRRVRPLGLNAHCNARRTEHPIDAATKNGILR